MATENLNAQQQDSFSYWQLYLIQNYLNRLAANLKLINAPPNAQTVTITNGNLFALAAQFYGDATQWPLIAKANGLIDPVVEGLTTLIIPPYDNQDTGGLMQ